MKDLGTLRKEAEQAIQFRGHHIVWMSPWHGENRSTQEGICQRCNKTVFINTNPLPNDIDIGGEAVALCCRKGK